MAKKKNLVQQGLKVDPMSAQKALQHALSYQQPVQPANHTQIQGAQPGAFSNQLNKQVAQQTLQQQMQAMMPRGYQAAPGASGIQQQMAQKAAQAQQAWNQQMAMNPPKFSAGASMAGQQFPADPEDAFNPSPLPSNGESVFIGQIFDFEALIRDLPDSDRLWPTIKKAYAKEGKGHYFEPSLSDEDLDWVTDEIVLNNGRRINKSSLRDRGYLNGRIGIVIDEAVEMFIEILERAEKDAKEGLTTVLGRAPLSLDKIVLVHMDMPSLMLEEVANADALFLSIKWSIKMLVKETAPEFVDVPEIKMSFEDFIAMSGN